MPTLAVRAHAAASLTKQLFAILYGTSHGCRWCLIRWSPTYRDMSLEHQGTCVVRPALSSSLSSQVYIQSLFWTTVALLLQLIAIPGLFGDDFTAKSTRETIVAGLIVCVVCECPSLRLD